MIGSTRRADRPRWIDTLVFALVALLVAAPPATATDDDDDDDDEINLVQYLESTGVDDDATAKARWEGEVEDDEEDDEEDDDDGEEEEEEEEEDEQEFKLQVKKLPPDTDFEFYVGDVLRAAFSTNGGGNATLEFEDDEEEEEEGDDDDLEFPFDFEVFEQVMEVRDTEGVVYFSDTFSPGGMQPGGKKKNPKAILEVLMANVSPDDFDARGRIHYKHDKGKTSLKVKLDDLDPGLYDLCVDGVSVLQFDTTGEDYEVVHLKFRDPYNGGEDDDDDEDEDDELSVKNPLDFDVLGAQVDIVLDKETVPVVVLTAVMPVTKQAGGDKGQSRGKKQARDVGRGKADIMLFRLLNTGVMPGAVGAVVVEVDEVDGHQELTVAVKKAGDASYSVMVDDDGDAETDLVEIGMLDVVGGVGEASFGVGEGDDELPELLGRRLDVVADGDTILSAVLPTSLPVALDKLKPAKRKMQKGTETVVDLRMGMHGTTEDIDATGDLRWKLKTKTGRRTFDVQVKDLPVGTYGLFVDGVQQASMEVFKGRAKLKFDSDLLEPKKGKLPMGFTVFGTLIEIRDAGDVAVLKAMLE